MSKSEYARGAKDAYADVLLFIIDIHSKLPQTLSIFSPIFEALTDALKIKISNIELIEHDGGMQ
jgi:hypothetical protein